ncbi:MAG: hypothetical protein V2B20_23455, partial [Pseudomonadota bacterium]
TALPILFWASWVHPPRSRAIAAISNSGLIFHFSKLNSVEGFLASSPILSFIAVVSMSRF